MTSLTTFIKPFNSLELYLKALVIVQKLFCHTKNNFKLVHECISQLVQTITKSETIAFVQLVNTYTDHPYEFLENQTQFIEDIYAFSIENEEQTTTLASFAHQCTFCGPNNANTRWFDFKSPDFSKDAILYETHKIGK